MSFDLIFIPKSADQTWDEAIDAAEADTIEGSPDARAWVRIVSDARQILGEVELHEGDDFYELDHEPTGIQVSLYPNEAAITVPYWYTGAKAREIVQLIYRLAAVIEEHTELSGYDGQAGLPVAEGAQRPEMAVACFDTVAESLARRGISSPSPE